MEVILINQLENYAPYEKELHQLYDVIPFCRKKENERDLFNHINYLENIVIMGKLIKMNIAPEKLIEYYRLLIENNKVLKL